MPLRSAESMVWCREELARREALFLYSRAVRDYPVCRPCEVLPSRLSILFFWLPVYDLLRPSLFACSPFPLLSLSYSGHTLVTTFLFSYSMYIRTFCHTISLDISLIVCTRVILGISSTPAKSAPSSTMWYRYLRRLTSVEGARAWERSDIVAQLTLVQSVYKSRRSHYIIDSILETLTSTLYWIKKV